MRPFGPRPDSAPRNLCAMCGKMFLPGDYTTLVATGPSDEEEMRNMEEGRPYMANASEICWSHRYEIAARTGEEIKEEQFGALSRNGLFE